MGQHKIKGASLGAKGVDYKRLQGKPSRLKGPFQKRILTPAGKPIGFAPALYKRPRNKRGQLMDCAVCGRWFEYLVGATICDGCAEKRAMPEPCASFECRETAGPGRDLCHDHLEKQQQSADAYSEFAGVLPTEGRK